MDNEGQCDDCITSRLRGNKIVYCPTCTDKEIKLLQRWQAAWRQWRGSNEKDNLVFEGIACDTIDFLVAEGKR